jgi:hypothetical protein
MRRISRLALVLSLAGLFFLPTLTQAQGLGDLRNQIQNVGQQYVDGYVQPVSDAFGADLNGGLFRTADVGNGFLPGLPINVYLGVSVSGALMGPANKSFTPPREQVSRTFTRNGQQVTQTSTIEVVGTDEVPNVFGETEPPQDWQLRITSVSRSNGNVVRSDTSTQAVPPGLVDTPVAPLIVPQLGLGTVAGTDVQVRYLPKVNLSYSGTDFGKVGMKGLAIRHDIDQWIPVPLPLQLAAQGSWNQFTFSSGGEELFDASGWALNVQASKGIPVVPVVVYGGLQYEKFNVEYNYEFQSPIGGGEPIPISLEQQASNTTRGILGLSVDLTVLRLNVDYAVSNGNNVATVGAGFRL